MTSRGKAWAEVVFLRVLAMVADLAIVAAAYLTAFLLRMNFLAPQWGWRAVGCSFATVATVHLLMLAVCGVYRRSWRQMRMTEVPRYLVAAGLSVVVLVAMRFAMESMAYAYLRPPYTVAAMTAVFASVGMIAVRFAWKHYLLERQRESGLLERTERRFDNTLAARFLMGKCVMVTGAGGSIGSEIVRQVAFAGASKILLVERGENALYEIDRKMTALCPNVAFVPIMADCGDEEKMDAVFEEHGPKVVLHAAAYKHVPMVEKNPEAGYLNNTQATITLAGLAGQHGVERFVMISTDKAVNPVSVMGKTKEAAERALMNFNRESTTSFAAVRFGNVLGSSGSVVPLFKEQIAKGGPVTVTHPDMKRYFMTVDEAVSLVLQAASRPERAIYTLDMGKPVRIVELAESMIRQAGYLPYVDIPIVFTGIRPGEKLFEELDISEKSCYKTDLAKIYITK
jgi:FlaA1/EpsC-like NDP-sugar epimerase